jgi:hypothetical protein
MRLPATSKWRSVRCAPATAGRIAVRGARRHGFTLIELFIASFLTVFLGLLISSIWVWVNKAGFPTDILARTLLMQEINMAVATFSRDFGGSEMLPSSYSTTAESGSVSTAIDQGRWIGWSTNGNDLSLCYDGGTKPDGLCDWTGITDTVVYYYLKISSNSLAANRGLYTLIRRSTKNGVMSEVVVAKNITAMSVSADSADSNFVKIILTFVFQRHSNLKFFGDIYTRTIALEVRKPQ